MTFWSIIVNRIDGISKAWTEWRVKLISISSGSVDAGAIPMLGSDGKIDPSMLTFNPESSTSMQVLVDFGTNIDFVTTPVVAPWVTASSVILCEPAAKATTDHDVEDVVLESLTAYAGNLNPGVGFDLFVRAPFDTFGTYYINIIGK